VRRWVGRFPGERVEVAVEACTGWPFACEALRAAGAGVHLAETVETRARRGNKRRAKTDRQDARWPRTLLAEGRLPQSWIPPTHVREWRTAPGCAGRSSTSAAPAFAHPSDAVSPRHRRRGSAGSRLRATVVSGLMTEIVYGLDGAQRDRIAALRKGGRFFWLDVSLSETRLDDLGETLDIPERADRALLGLWEGHRTSRKFYADGQHVVFAFSCYLESAGLAAESPYRLRPVEVHVLVSGDYLLTLHEERLSLPELLAPDVPEGRSEQYVVYAVIDAMVASAFDALNEVELTLDDLALMSTDLRSGRLRMATLRAISSRLARMRRRVGPQRGLFERIGVEIGRLRGLEADDERYFDRIGEQVNRLVDAIDAAADAMARLIELRLNETSYWLTVVATIFLPLTFITGFFGMNFDWMVARIDTQLAFWLLGIGTPVAGVVLIWRLVVRGSPVQPDPDTADAAHRSPQELGGSLVRKP
jgi:magnesium transporter